MFVVYHLDVLWIRQSSLGKTSNPSECYRPSTRATLHDVFRPKGQTLFERNSVRLRDQGVVVHCP